MISDRAPLTGARTLVVGASSGIGREVARAARRNGARVAVAARRVELLESLAVELDGTAHELDVTNAAAISAAVGSVAAVLGGIDVLVCSCGVFPLAPVEYTDAATWSEAFAVNTIGPALLMSAAFPFLSKEAVILVISSDRVGRPPAGTAAYSASKVALDEILHSWRCEHPELRVIRVGVGPTDGTEIMRGADRDLLADLVEVWTRDGRVPDEMGDVVDVADTVVAMIAAVRGSASIVAENLQLRPRASARAAISVHHGDGGNRRQR